MLLQMTVPVQGGLRQERKIELTSNHLANYETAGFKQGILSFDNLLKTTLTTDFTQGDIKLTGSNLDVALKDKGFFKIQTPKGIRYTRDGNFSLNQNGILVTQSGNPVLGDGGTITINGNNIDINSAGQIQVDGNIQNKLSVVNFDDLTKLKKEGNSLYEYTGQPQDEKPSNAGVKQNALEMSNVNVTVEMTNMIDLYRKYESFSKMIQSFDETDGKAINEVGKV